MIIIHLKYYLDRRVDLIDFLNGPFKSFFASFFHANALEGRCRKVYKSMLFEVIFNLLK